MLHYGILSTASIVPRFVEGLRLAGDEVAAIGSRDGAKAAALAQKLGIPRAFGSYEEVLRSEDVDVVYIPLINHQHYPWAKAALLAGKHVVLEKPFVLAPEEARELQNLAREKGLFLFEGVKNLFLPSTAFVRENLQKIGPVIHVSTRQGTRTPFPSGHWMYDISKGGGAYAGSCAYIYHYLHHLLGGEVTDLRGTYRPFERSDIDCAFTFRQGDTLATSAILMSGDADNMAVLFGTKGRLEIDHFWRSHDVRLILHDGTTETFHDSGSEFQYECRHIADCISRGLTESPVLPLTRSIREAELLQELYREWGMVPGDCQ